METRLSKKRKLESAEEENTPSTSLLDLPMEMLLYLGQFLELKHIFKFRCYSRYSREVGNAMLSDLRGITIGYEFPGNKRQLRVILKQCHRLREITIQYGDKGILTDKAIENLLSNNPLLKEVDLWVLGNTGISPKALVPLATKCKNLLKLSILRFYPGNEFLENLSAHNNHLVEVYFDFNLSSVYWEKIWKFIENQPKLKRIFLPNMITLSLRGLSIDEIYENILFTIAEFCKELTYLGNLRGRIHALRKIIENCPKLNRIEFAYDERVSDEMLSYLRSKGIDVDGGCSESDLDSDLDNERYWELRRQLEFFFDDSDDSDEDSDSDQD